MKLTSSTFRGLAATVAAFALVSSAHAFSSLVVLGDSLSDNGNNAAVFAALTAPGAPPITPVSAISNSFIPDFTYASGTYSNGPTWVTPFANALGLGSFAAAALNGGGNLAYGGARTSGSGFPLSLQSQLSLLPAAGLNDTLLVVAGGGNNARDALQAAAADLPNALATIGGAAQSFSTDIHGIVDSLQARGAQRIVVWNVPNIGLAPAVRAQGQQASNLGTIVSAVMNNSLATELQGEAGVTIFDVFGLVSIAAANPGAFGLTNVTDACGTPGLCDPATALFWDGIHPTTTGHNLLAAGMVAAVQAPVPEPATVALWFAGLLGLGGVARRRAVR